MNKDNYNILTDEELVRMAREGSVTAEEFLINKYKELARVKSSVYFIVGGDRDDVIQEGMIGIFKAIRDFDEEKNTSFRTFAEVCVNRQIISAIRKANLRKHQILNESVSLSQEQDARDSEKIFAGRLDAGDKDDPETLMLMKEITDFLLADKSELFSPLEQQVLTLMLKGKKYREIAAELDRSVKTVDNAIQRIKKKIYNYLGY